MTNFDLLTDFELNLMAARLLLDWDDIETAPRKKEQTAVAWADGYNWYNFDPCNDWRVVGPLLVTHKISLTIKNRYFPTLSWVATEVTSDVEPKTSSHANPLRAAVIVFLKMRGVV